MLNIIPGKLFVVTQLARLVMFNSADRIEWFIYKNTDTVMLALTEPFKRPFRVSSFVGPDFIWSCKFLVKDRVLELPGFPGLGPQSGRVQHPWRRYYLSALGDYIKPLRNPNQCSV